VEVKAGLMRGVTHDLKNPLGAAASYVDLLAEDVAGPLTDEQRRIVGRVSRLVSISLETVSDLLELSRVEAGHLAVEAVPTDVAHLAREAAGDFEASARSARLALDVRAVDALPIVETDPARVRQVLGNLLSNAIKYTPREGRVVVRATCEQRNVRLDCSGRGTASPGGAVPPEGAWVALAVEDTGPGIPPAYRERIFDEFFRPPSTPTDASGTGVGLAISRRIARLLGGDVTVADASGGGSVFTLWLPVRPRRDGVGSGSS
jgi:signal transduction histidine kinase